MNFVKIAKKFPLINKLKNTNVPKNVSTIKNIQDKFINFYDPKSIQPYIPINAIGPWILTSENKIVYDCGGYGMLGLGHNDPSILSELSKPQVMANMMTPNYSQLRFSNILKQELNNKYSKFITLNSGSEANTLAMRIANIHSNKNPVLVTMKDSFHGRTEKPSLVSDSCLINYKKHLSDYQKDLPVYSIEYNNLDSLHYTFNQIKDKNQFPEITMFEPVQGEGNPGIKIDINFYNSLRKYTKQFSGLLLSDSIQAGFRCTGQLSITNYPGFEDIDPPDFETFSKALNSGQYPLSVLAVNDSIKDRYVTGLYGNTMCGNPRALDISSMTLELITPDIKNNIVISGNILLKNFNLLKEKYSFIENITGTGLLLAIHLKSSIPVLVIEKNLRLKGLNVIHGGKNALRLTPWFKISDDEIQLICNILDNEFENWLSSNGERP